MKVHRKYLLILLFSSSLVACGGGGSNGSNVPTDAITFTSANAETYARAGLAQIDTVDATTDFALKSDSTTPIRGTIKLAIDQISKHRPARKSIIANRSITENCGEDSSFGSITYDTTESAGIESGSITFNNCNILVFTINGGFTFSATSDSVTGAFTETGEGSLSFAFDTEQFTITMGFDVSGNETSGEFSETINFSITGITGGGFTLTTTQPITGVGSDITGGQIVITGANSTRIRVTVVGTNLVDIELDDGSGTFAPHSSGVMI